MKRKVQTIKISSHKKKPLGLVLKKFDALTAVGVQKIYQFLTLEEVFMLLRVSYVFQEGLAKAYSIDTSSAHAYIKYLSFFFQVEKTSSHNPYINYFNGINLVNIKNKKIFTEEEEKGKLLALEHFLNYIMAKTKNNKFFLFISSDSEVEFHKKLIPRLNNFTQLKYIIRIFYQIINFQIVSELFQLLHNTRITEKSEFYFSELQQYMIKNQIKCMHYKILYDVNQLFEETKDYFTKYPNHLLSIKENQDPILVSLNQNSIENILGEFTLPSNFKGRIRKVKILYASEEYNKFLPENANLDLVEVFGGFVTTEDDVNDCTNFINSMYNLKEISRFQLNEDLTGGDPSLFEPFFGNINSKEITKIRSWFYQFKKGKDYSYLINKFPLLRCVQEDYDASGLYDLRFEIDKVFSCNAELKLNENDLEFLVKLVHNYLAHKREGEKHISFTLSIDLSLIMQFFNYCEKMQERKIIDSVYTINMLVSESPHTEKRLPWVEKMMYFKAESDNEVLMTFLSGLKHVEQIEVENKKMFLKHFEFISKMSPISVIYNGSLEEEILVKLKEIKSLEFVLVKDGSVDDKEHKFAIIQQNKVQ